MFTFTKQNSQPVQPKKIKYKRPALWVSAFLLSASFILFVCIFVLNYLNDIDNQTQLAQLIENKNIQNAQKINFSEVNNINKFNDLHNQVKPVKFASVLLEQRKQDEAFQDMEYIAKRKKAWTVEIMDVASLEIIKDYLITKEKKSQFAYFRYIKDEKKRFILTFDDFNGEAAAKVAIDRNDFDLPVSVEPYARAFKDYLNIVEQYHLESKVKNLRKNRHREIKLVKIRPSKLLSSSKTSKPNTKSHFTDSSKTKRYKRKVDNNAFTKNKRPIVVEINKQKPKSNPSNDLIEDLIKDMQ